MSRLFATVLSFLFVIDEISVVVKGCMASDDDKIISSISDSDISLFRPSALSFASRLLITYSNAAK